MRRSKRKESAKVEYDPSVWQFQLMPVDEMDVEELIAMDNYYSNYSTQPIENDNELNGIFIRDADRGCEREQTSKENDEEAPEG